MAAPKGPYTPTRGPQAGQTYPSYYSYQKARASRLGFAGYTEQRKATASPSYDNAVRIAQRESGHRPTVAEREQIQTLLGDLSKLSKGNWRRTANRSPNGRLARTLVALGFRDPRSRKQVGDS